jgi:hypothetical protein
LSKRIRSAFPVSTGRTLASLETAVCEKASGGPKPPLKHWS